MACAVINLSNEKGESGERATALGHSPGSKLGSGKYKRGERAGGSSGTEGFLP